MLRNLYEELRQINKELHAIRKNLEFFEPEKANSAHVGTSSNHKVRTNVDDKPTAKSSVNISEVLHDLANKTYRGV